MTSMRELPPELLRRFTQVDYADHLALVAEVFVDGRETVIAEARYVRGADPSVAEFAVSVAEPWQGKRLASLLLGKLACRAAAAGVRRMVGETLATNAKMISLARKAGFTVQPSPDVRGLMLLEKVLPGAQPCNDAEAARWPRARNARECAAARYGSSKRDPTSCESRYCVAHRSLTRHAPLPPGPQGARHADHDGGDGAERRREQQDEHQHRRERPHHQRGKDDARADEPEAKQRSRAAARRSGVPDRPRPARTGIGR